MSEVPVGKYMLLKAKESELYICPQLCDGKAVLGQYQEGNKQLWYYEPSSSTLRNKETDKVLTFAEDGSITLEEYDPNRNEFQAVVLNKAEGTIKPKVMSGKNFGVQEMNSGASVCLKECAKDSGWLFVNPNAILFRLKATDALVLATEENAREAGTRLVLAAKTERSDDYNQLFYEDREGILRAGTDHLVLDSSRCGEIILEYPENDKSTEQKWRYYNPSVYLEGNGKYMAVVKDDLKAGSRVEAINSSEHGKRSSVCWSKEYTK